MSQSRRFFLLLAIALVVITTVTVMVSRLEEDPESSALLFPGLEARLDAIDAVSIATQTQKVTLQRVADGWVVTGLDNYPAETKRIHRLLLGLSGLRVVEPKTRNPDLYDRVRLRGLDVEGSQATEVRLSVADASIGEILIGSQSPSRSNPSMAEVFVRRPGEDRVWLVEGRFDPLSARTADWARGELLSLDRARIYAAATTDQSGQPIQVSRSLGDRDFALQDMPEGKRIKYQFAVNDVAATYAELRLDAVREGVPETWESESSAVMKTFDGLEVVVSSYSAVHQSTDGEGPWITLEAREGERLTPAAESAGSDGPDSRQEIALKSEAEIRAEVSELNDRWAGWRFRLPQVVYDRVFPNHDELFEDAAADHTTSQD